NAQNSELHCQYIALLAARVVTGRLVNSGHFAVRKGGGVEARRLNRVFVEPETNRVLWLHGCVLLCARSGRTPRSLRRTCWPVATSSPLTICWLSVIGCRLSVAALETRLSAATDNRQPTTDNRQPITDNRLASTRPPSRKRS